ncbi:MAG: radical SAM family heme chaperone HemW [Chloroflexota bacterium]
MPVKPGTNRALARPRWDSEDISAASDGFAVYCHVPFCATRCVYCDFVTYTRLGHLRGLYLEALAREAEQVATAAGHLVRATSFYFGGGTPSLLPAKGLADLLVRLRQLISWDPAIEITVEVNPGDACGTWLEKARAAGVNRLSLGMQAADDTLLAFLGRRHRHADTRRAVLLARRAGFDNLSLDLMYGIPGQGIEAWRDTVERALELEPEHLSTYALSLEPGTPLAGWVRRGLVECPDDDLAADQFEWLAERVVQEGYVQYEISNWAKGSVAEDGHPRYACRHNLTYWENRPYLGLGAGAHGFANGMRYAVCQSVRDYIDRVTNRGSPTVFPLSPAVEWWEHVGAEEAANDSLLLGLRLTTLGVRASDYQARHGAHAWQSRAPTLNRLAADGLVEWVDGCQRVRLTARGRLMGNQVFREFV